MRCIAELQSRENKWIDSKTINRNERAGSVETPFFRKGMPLSISSPRHLVAKGRGGAYVEMKYFWPSRHSLHFPHFLFQILKFIILFISGNKHYIVDETHNIISSILLVKHCCPCPVITDEYRISNLITCDIFIIVRQFSFLTTQELTLEASKNWRPTVYQNLFHTISCHIWLEHVIVSQFNVNVCRFCH